MPGGPAGCSVPQAMNASRRRASSSTSRRAFRGSGSNGSILTRPFSSRELPATAPSTVKEGLGLRCLGAEEQRAKPLRQDACAAHVHQQSGVPCGQEARRAPEWKASGNRTPRHVHQHAILLISEPAQPEPLHRRLPPLPRQARPSRPDRSPGAGPKAPEVAQAPDGPGGPPRGSRPSQLSASAYMSARRCSHVPDGGTPHHVEPQRRAVEHPRVAAGHLEQLGPSRGSLIQAGTHQLPRRAPPPARWVRSSARPRSQRTRRSSRTASVSGQ